MKPKPWTFSSVGESGGLISRKSGVRVPEGLPYDLLAQLVEHGTFKIRSLMGKLISENIAKSGKAKS